jgi:hypothetical protein
MGSPDLPKPPSAPPPPPDLADSIVRQNDSQMRRRQRSQMGMSRFFEVPKAGTAGANAPTPANMGSKTLLGQ